MKKIVIDARLWGIKNTGIGRYIQELIAHLHVDPDVELHLIVSSDNQANPELVKFKKYVAKYHPYKLGSLIEIPLLLLKIKPDLVHIPHLTIPVFWPGKIIITIHDLIKHESRGPMASTHSALVYWLKYIQYIALSTFAVYRANHIIVPAQYWKDRLIAKYGIHPNKVTVTHEGVTSVSKNPDPHLDLPKKPYVLYVGNMYPHKNVPVLLGAIKRLSGKVVLLLVCSRTTFTDRIEAMIKAEDLDKWAKFLGFVTDNDLFSLYSNSLAFVFPSKIEGFGLPGLEAMAANTPVIAANSSCLPEIYGPAALYFDPDSPQDLADKIESLYDNPSLRKSMIALGKKQVSQYSWSKMANQTWSIYKKYI